jgi:uncharacterized protein (TIGR03435 family)
METVMRIFVCLAAAALGAATLSATTQNLPVAPQSLDGVKFDVVSVRRNPGTGGMQARTVPGSFSVVGIPLRFVIRQAYQVQDFQIAGGPDWMNSDLFDIDARFDVAVGPVGPQALAARLRNMLVERFKFAAHIETREMPIFALVRAREDRLGAQIKPSAVDCSTMSAPGRQAGPGPDGRPICGGRGGPGQILAGGLTMAQLAAQLSQYTGRLIVDRTGLTGSYAFDLSWSPALDQMPSGLPRGGAPPFDADAPTLFTALEEQLGLKLDSGRGPVDVVVVDRVEHPAEN